MCVSAFYIYELQNDLSEIIAHEVWKWKQNEKQKNNCTVALGIW